MNVRQTVIRTVIPTVIALATGLHLGSLHYKNAEPTATKTQTVYETVTRTTTERIDLERLRDVSATSHHDEQLNYECTVALERLTGDPYMGIVLYVDRWWEGDACAAYEHQVTYGWH